MDPKANLPLRFFLMRFCSSLVSGQGVNLLFQHLLTVFVPIYSCCPVSSPLLYNCTPLSAMFSTSDVQVSIPALARSKQAMAAAELVHAAAEL